MLNIIIVVVGTHTQILSPAQYEAYSASFGEHTAVRATVDYAGLDKLLKAGALLQPI